MIRAAGFGPGSRLLRTTHGRITWTASSGRFPERANSFQEDAARQDDITTADSPARDRRAGENQGDSLERLQQSRELETGRHGGIVLPLAGHRKTITDVAVSPDGRHALSIGESENSPHVSDILVWRLPVFEARD